MKRNAGLLILLSIFIACSGCSNRPAGMPGLSPCKIIVTQDGAPLAGASVVMINSDTTTGEDWTPMGTTDQSGVAVMRTNAQYDGAAVGKYKIVVTKTETEESKLGPPPPPDSPDYDNWAHKNANENIASFNVVEATYSSPKTTPHEIEVTKGSNEVKIDVGKPIRVKM